MRKVLLLTCIVSFIVLGVRGVSAGTPRTPNNTTSPLGTNFHFFADWSSEYVFINAFRMARPWITSNYSTWDTHESDQLAYHLDENGYPTRLPAENDPNVLYRFVTTLMFTDLAGNYPTGEYTVLYDGEGTLSYGRDVVEVLHSQQGREVIRVEANSGILLRIMTTNPSNHLRNIRVIMPGYTEEQADTQIYHNDFLDSIDQFHVLRFMDWMRTNWDENGPIDRSNVNDGSWAERALPTDGIYTTAAGMPVEVMVDLSNTLHADPWFTHSHQATDSDIQQFATLVRDTLATDRNVYLEYSNEVWNYGFAQGTWIEEMGKLDPEIGEGSNLQKRLSWYGKRSTQMCDIWKTVWGAESDRVICTIATQAANPWVGEQMLDCPLWSGRPCYDKVDAVAIAPYFGQHIGHPKYMQEVLLWLNEPDGGLSKLFQEVEYGNVLSDRSGEYVYKTTVSNAIGYAETYTQMADERNIAVVSYEGGQHLVGIGGVQNNQNIHHLFMEANKDLRMADMYESYLAGWHNTGSQFFNHYANSGLYTKWGYWGAQEFLTEPTTPKQAAVETHISTTPCDWDSCTASQGTPTSIVVSSQEIVPRWSLLFLLIPFGLLLALTLRHRHVSLLLLAFVFIGCQQSVVEPAAADMGDPTIVDFFADVSTFIPGDSILLTWETEGVSSMMLRTMTFDATVGGIREQVVNADGTLLVTPGLEGTGNIVFELYNEDAEISQLIELEGECNNAWQFSPSPSQCAALPLVNSDAWILTFEHGYMIYIPTTNAVWVMTMDGSRSWDLRDTYDPAVDMFEDPSINPPLLSNFYEPTGAMGKVWREVTDVRDTLGWATLPAPIPYVAIVQCTTYTHGGFCLLNSAPVVGFVLRFSRDPIWFLDFNASVLP